MRKLTALCTIAALAAFTGCNNSPTGGNPAASKEQFHLSGPLGTTTIKQGDRQTVKATRGSDFKQDVKLKVQDLPKGVTVEPAAPTIKASEESTTLTIDVAKDAPMGDGKIHVEATPTEGGVATTLDVPIKVEKGEK